MTITEEGLSCFFIGSIIALPLICIWFIPVFCSRGNENGCKIFWICLFLGWIPIIWLVLLVSALLGSKKKKEK